ncbi:MAG TPA: proteasome assembly chaperone family protein [Thermoplasmatales archaeon]|nr:proteasome assembly chaperone family protein [Thermoplasmatales archaeon]
MDEEIQIIEYKQVDLSNAILIEAFPTVGLVSSIAGRFLIDQLKLQEIGMISSRYFMPAAVIHKGTPSPPVRIYAGMKVCGQGSSCDQIVVIISEFMPSVNIIKPLADVILKWAKKKKCKYIVTLEGTHALDSKKPKTYGVATTKKMEDILKQHGIRETQEGMITGITGVLLYEGVRLKYDVLCLLAEAHTSYPDSRAAALLVEALDKMLPEIEINTKPLYKEADDIEKKIRMFIKQAQPTAPSSAQPTHMYG